MKFTSLLSAVAVICSYVGYVSASSSSLEIGFSTDCNKKVNCSVSYCEGMWKNSNSEIDVSHLAGNINEISRGGLLVGSASKEYFDYDNNLGINGGTYNNASSNLDGLCLVAENGINKFKKPNGTKYKFGVMYDISGMTDVLDRRGLTITDMTASPSVPAGTRILALNQLSELLNSGAGTVALNGRLKSVKGLHQPEDRITRTKVGQLIGDMINDSAVRAFMQPANTYLLVSIS